MSLKDSFLVSAPAQPRATPQSKDIAPASVVTGGSNGGANGTAAGASHSNPAADKGNPLGVGTLGNSARPFRLGGG